ncbi:MAG: hypothetical protein U5J95_02300 [Balneolaceae bacterium]|nr:hypothetical protein [Balneolaceae bacterium]
MIKSLIAVIVGQLSITLLQTFSRVVVGAYFRTELTITGISHLPSLTWMYFLTALNFIFGMFGGLITSSLARNKGRLEVLILALLIFIWGLFSFQMTLNTEPVWYRILAPLLTIFGVMTGYLLKKNMDTNIKNNGHQI